MMQSFQDLIPDEAQVMRSGQAVHLRARDLVPGDILLITFGDKISADVRIIESQSLKTDHSTLTGESEPLTRSAKCTHEDPMETSNLAFFGTYAIEGTGKGVVIRTGDKTVMGMTASLTNNIKERPTVMAQEIKHFIIILVAYATCMGLVFFAVMIGIGYSWQEGLIFFIGIIIANVPEGLMPTLTLSLTLASQRMAARNCLVKKLESVETLGNTSVVCTDKTGTLTQNRMTVAHFWYDRRIIDRQLLGRGSAKFSSVCFTALARCATLCSRAEFKSTRGRQLSVSKRDVIGDPSESAILKTPELSSEDEINELRETHSKIFEIPFNSYDKFQLSIHQDNENKHILVMKGAPEVIIPRCSTILLEEGSIPMTEEQADNVLEACNILAASGERVMAFCDDESVLYLDESFKAPKGGLRFLGLISLQDPPRPNVPEAVLECRRAGIKVIMVTGDHKMTAEAIAKQVHIISDYSVVQRGIGQRSTGHEKRSKAIILEGKDLQNVAELELDEIISEFDELIFARTSPRQKLKIVESCQRLGAIVAVTGDGVNDSPALKKADIGVAMGLSGSAVARQSANIVLLDDNFATLARGIEEGRLVFENLKKSVGYTLSHTLPELLLLLSHITVGVPLPMGIVTMLCIDVGTDMWPSIALAHESAELDLMKQKPRDVRRDRLVNVPLLYLAAQMGLLESAAGMFVYFLVMAQCGWLPPDLVGIKKYWSDKNQVLADSYGVKWSHRDRQTLEYTCYTAVFAAVAIAQVANAFVFKTSRSSNFNVKRCNINLGVAILFSMFLVCFLSYVPGVSKLFRMRPLRLQWWLPALPFAAALIAYDETRKNLVRKRPNGWFAKNTVP